MWLLIIACSSAPSSPVDPAPAAPAAPDEGALGEHMHDHLAKANVAHEALVHGDIDGARAALKWLGEHEAPPLPTGAESHLKRMQGLAKKAADAPQYDEVATTIGRLGAACGSCHEAQEVRPAIVIGQPPQPSQEINAHMARHQWAVQSLWTGLVVPSDAAWKAGAEALADEHLADARFEVPELSDEAKAQAKAAHALARKASKLSDVEARAKAFGTITTACAGCHAEMRGE